ncbi:PIH1 domain-containing protein 2 isoform X2 [Amia ocellicauda]|uniref:PIH1 domain-containing protein 2 isoform X2 n=1 Tax=Amia ocellicauda TaxID=2972642 RepID=UPI003464780E
MRQQPHVLDERQDGRGGSGPVGQERCFPGSVSTRTRQTMAGPLTQQAVLQQVSQMWSMLDEMAESSPQSYRHFIQRHLQEGVNYSAPPQPHTCLRTEVLEPEEGVLYINVCSWKRVPAPGSDTEPVPLNAGKLEKTTEGKEVYSVIAVAFSPEVLCRAERDGAERDQLLRLAMRYTEQQHGLRLSPCYALASANLKGSAQRMRSNLAGRRQPQSDVPAQPVPDRGSLLRQISALRRGGEEEEAAEGQGSATVQLFPASEPRKAGLIQVISSTETPQLQRPLHRLWVNRDAGGRAQAVRLTVELPGISSVSECRLSISQDDVLIEVEDLYHLHLDLPEMVNDEAASAKFSKRTHVLTVNLPVL